MSETVLLNYDQVDSLLDLTSCLRTTEDAYRLCGEEKVFGPNYSDVLVPGGEFHVKEGGILLEDRAYFSVKESGCFFGDRNNSHLPNSNGMIILCDGTHGAPLAVLNANPVTAKRTAAATAVAAKYMARGNSSTVTLCGAGTQERYQLRALNKLFNLKKVFIHDRSIQAMDLYVADMAHELDINVYKADEKSLEDSVRQSDILVTCTPLPKGIFVSAIGSDNKMKQELEHEIIASYRTVVDKFDQCKMIGETHHALQHTDKIVCTEIEDIVTGRSKGRTDEDEIIIFDSTGIAIQVHGDSYSGCYCICFYLQGGSKTKYWFLVFFWLEPHTSA